MSNSNNNQINIPLAHEAMDRFKMQAAQKDGVNLTNGYNGHLTSREAGHLSGWAVCPTSSICATRMSPAAII